jgi:hypothetical protein
MSGIDELPSPKQVPVPAEAKTAATRGKLAFFVGAGISRLYNLPSWDGLCERMLNSLAANNIINHNKVELLTRQPLKARISIADHYFKNARKVGNTNLSYKRDLYAGYKEVILTEVTAYTSLAKCGVKFVTTNYDDLLLKAMEGVSGIAEAVENANVNSQVGDSAAVDKTPVKTVKVYGDPKKFDRSQLLNNNVIFHLHGSIKDENTIVASTTDYLELYSNPNIQSFLNWFFENNVVVFLGYGLDELELLDLIIRSGSKSPKTGRPNSLFLLLPMLSHEAEILEQLKIYYSQLGIEVLPFSIDERGFASYADLLELWSGELAEKVKEAQRVETLKLMDSLLREFEERSK